MGVTLYAFVYGQIPFRDENVMVLYHKIQNDPVVFQEQPPISEDLKELISQMLHKDPSQRLTLPEVKVRQNYNKEQQKQKQIIIKAIQKHIIVKCESVYEEEPPERTFL